MSEEVDAPIARQGPPGAESRGRLDRRESPAGAMQIISEDPPPPSQISDAIVVGLSLFAAVCGIVFGVTITVGGPLPLYGFALAAGLFSLAYAVRRYFADRFPDVDAIEPRFQLADDDSDSDGQALGDLAEIPPVGRRPLLRRILIGSAGAFGAGLLAPAINLGPRPGDALRRTKWGPGVRVVTVEGDPVRPENIANGGVVSGWPEGSIGAERSAILVIRLSSDPEDGIVREWLVDGDVVAYSKICTHAGCPVALYREQDSALFCPCHQSTFAVDDGARPTFGPAARPLPQLPLGVDEEGFLIATSDFHAQVGPAFD